MSHYPAGHHDRSRQPSLDQRHPQQQQHHQAVDPSASPYLQHGQPLHYYYDNTPRSSVSGQGTQHPLQIDTSIPPIHAYDPVQPSPGLDRGRASLSLHLPPQHMQPPPDSTPGGQYLVSPSYYSPAIPVSTGSGNSQAHMTEYFPPYESNESTPTAHHTSVNVWMGQPGPSSVNPQTSPTTTTVPSQSHGQIQAVQAGPSNSSTKTPRHQFTACGACRHRRVKCDLRVRQEEAERQAADEGDIGPARSRRKKVSCTNCEERGTNCVDEYAPLKAAKQLRRGKRISEIEMLFGKSATNAALATQSDAASDRSTSPRRERIPELTREFFDSPFFRRFNVQRPVIDPIDFTDRYFSKPVPTAAAMGPEGAILCHCLFAWAVSYGVDERGQLDIPEGGGEPMGNISLMSAGDGEIIREQDRLRRKERMTVVVQIILKEIDEAGIMRKPTWDGVRVLLLILPLTEGIAPPIERLAMYEAAISQVYVLCSFSSTDYDGRPAAASGANGGTDKTGGGRNMHLVRVRIYWYSFVHEGITVGLKGGHLHLDDEDLDTMQDAIGHKSLVHNGPQSYQAAASMATAPIRLALACRLIHKALTGPKAKRRSAVSAEHLNDAWEALEGCWEEFDAIKYARALPAYHQQDEITRFADGWKIFLFEAQNVIRTSLEERIARMEQARQGAFLSDPNSPDNVQSDLLNLQHLVDIARVKCESRTRQILEIVRNHVGSTFFEWDASLVRDGTFYAAMLLAKEGNGSDEDIAVCLQALNELRWAHAKSAERSHDLRSQWYDGRMRSQGQGQGGPVPVTATVGGGTWDPNTGGVMVPSNAMGATATSTSPVSIAGTGGNGGGEPHGSSLSDSPYTSPDLMSPIATFDPTAHSVRGSASSATTVTGGTGPNNGGSSAAPNLHPALIAPTPGASTTSSSNSGSNSRSSGGGAGPVSVASGAGGIQIITPSPLENKWIPRDTPGLLNPSSPMAGDAGMPMGYASMFSGAGGPQGSAGDPSSGHQMSMDHVSHLQPPPLRHGPPPHVHPSHHNHHLTLPHPHTHPNHPSHLQAHGPHSPGAVHDPSVHGHGHGHGHSQHGHSQSQAHSMGPPQHHGEMGHEGHPHPHHSHEMMIDHSPTISQPPGQYVLQPDGNHVFVPYMQ